MTELETKCFRKVCGALARGASPDDRDIHILSSSTNSGVQHLSRAMGEVIKLAATIIPAKPAPAKIVPIAAE